MWKRVWVGLGIWGILIGGAGSAFGWTAQEATLITVRQDGEGDYTTIQAAINSIPSTLLTSYIVEIQDSETYAERAKIKENTDETHTITLRAAAGQTPTLRPPNKKDGILIQSSYVTIEGCAIDASNKYGINVDNEDHVTIRNCTVYGGTSQGGIKLHKTDYSRVVGNRVYDNKTGIRISKQSDYNSLRNNLIYLNSQYAVYVDDDADSDTLINNAIGESGKGLYFRGGGHSAGDHHVVRNNIFYEVEYCIYLAKALGSTFDECDYNDLYPESGGEVGYLSGTRYETLAEWQAASGLDGNSLSQDPLFADVSGDPEDRDLHLKSQAGRWDGSGWVTDSMTSPCIDAGDPSDDYGDEPAPNGSRINMGVYGNTGEASRSGLSALYKGGIPYDEYVMIGVPMIPTNGNPDSVLSDDFPGEGVYDPWGYWWRLVRWDTDAGGYRYYKEPLGTAGDPLDFYPGRGYWLSQWWSMEYDGTTVGDTISVTGSPVPTGTDFVIPLEFPENPGPEDRGLNQLANPFAFAIDWQNAKVRKNSDGQVRTILQAANARWVDGYAYLWDWEHDYYMPISPSEGGTIEQWLGFWVEQLNSSLDLSLLLPPAPVRSSSMSLELVSPSLSDWYLQFSVACSLMVQAENGTDTVWYRDVYNRIGMKPDASRQYDAYDAIDLPVPTGHYVYVFFPHDDPEDPEAYWPERPGRYTYDIRSLEGHDEVWTFVVQTDLADTELTWTCLNSGSVPLAYLVSLEDADADSVIVSDIRELVSYTFSSGTQGKRTFRLHTVYEDVTGDVTGDRTVSAYDAALILRYVVGLEPLPDFVLELANVSGNVSEDLRKAVTPYDAALILRYAVGLMEGFPTEGEEAPKPVETERIVCLSDPISRAEGMSVVPLLIDELDGVLSGVVRISFDAARMNVEDVVIAEPISEYLSVHTVEEGDLAFAFAGARSARGAGTLAEIILRPKRSDREILGHLHLDAVQLNEGLIRTRISSPRPEAYCLYPNFPNPFNPNTTIRFDLPVRSSVTLSIYNAVGQRIRTLVRGDREAGPYAVVWDSRNESGHPVASGVYLCHMEVDGAFSRTQRMVLLK